MSEPDQTPPTSAPTGRPSTAVSRYEGPQSISELTAYANLLALNPGENPRPNLALPRTFQGNPAALAFAVEYARTLDIPPVAAITGMHIVDGKPTASATLIDALIRRAGHKIVKTFSGTYEDGDLKATCTITRWDDPDNPITSTWTMQRAVRAKLMKRLPDGRFVAAKERSAWDTYPEAMLKSRCLTEAGRDAAADALMGLHYTPEELGADVDEHGEVVYNVTQVKRWGDGDNAQPTADKPAEPAPISVEYVDELRQEIFALASINEAKALFERVKASGVFKGDLWSTTSMGDRDGVASTCRDVFNAEVARLKAAGTPDDGQPAETPSGPESGPEGDNLGLPYEVVRLPNGEVDQVATLRNELAWKQARRAEQNPVAPAEDEQEADPAGQVSAVDQFKTALAEMTPQEVKALTAQARAWGRTLTHDNPDHNERDARALLEAVDRLLAWRPYNPTNYGNPAVDRRIDHEGNMEVPAAMPTAEQAASMGLDAVPVEEIRHGVQQEHEATIAEQRHADTVEDRSEQARQFDPPPLGKDAAIAAAREANRNAEVKTHPAQNPAN